ncbi:thioredoxin [Lophiotrema nucula]|uniref:Thioredoxin n=1 Tax=Lophiotrema nucula TaxID=690887 RepID=A0A6A5YXB0_9PLEO|nr:thioredoxin [Lophiotrema nucula]
MPTEITSTLHFRTLLNGHQYVIADFYATWCPPCKAISPVYENLSKAHAQNGKFAFVKINVDEQAEVAQLNGISAMPTFILFKNGKAVETIRGANPPALKKAIEGASADLKATAAIAPKKEEVQVEEKKETSGEVKDEKTVSGSYGMTTNNNWKMSLN